MIVLAILPSIFSLDVRRASIILHFNVVRKAEQTHLNSEACFVLVWVWGIWLSALSETRWWSIVWEGLGCKGKHTWLVDFNCVELHRLKTLKACPAHSSCVALPLRQWAVSSVIGLMRHGWGVDVLSATWSNKSCAPWNGRLNIMKCNSHGCTWGQELCEEAWWVEVLSARL